MGFPDRARTKKMVNFKATARDWGELQMLQLSISLDCSVSEALRTAIREACTARKLQWTPPGLEQAPSMFFAVEELEPPVDQELEPPLVQVAVEPPISLTSGKTKSARARKPAKTAAASSARQKRKQNTAGVAKKSKKRS